MNFFFNTMFTSSFVLNSIRFRDNRYSVIELRLNIELFHSENEKYLKILIFNYNLHSYILFLFNRPAVLMSFVILRTLILIDKPNLFPCWGLLYSIVHK